MVVKVLIDILRNCISNIINNNIHQKKNNYIQNYPIYIDKNLFVKKPFSLRKSVFVPNILGNYMCNNYMCNNYMCNDYMRNDYMCNDYINFDINNI